MRTHRQLVVYKSVLQALHEPGCPLWRYLMEYQADQLDRRLGSETRRLCNSHAWGLAAVQDAPSAAQVLFRILNEGKSIANGTRSLGEWEGKC